MTVTQTAHDDADRGRRPPPRPQHRGRWHAPDAIVAVNPLVPSSYELLTFRRSATDAVTGMWIEGPARSSGGRLAGMSTTSPIVLEHATLVDGTGAEPVVDAHIVVEQGRITTVGTGPARTSGRVIDCSGVTVLPGLIDLHTHMGLVHAAVSTTYPPAVTAAHLFRNAELCLLSGHTTAREVGGADGGLRQVIDLGLIPGPRLLPSGPLISQTGGHGDHGTWFLDHHHHPQYLGVPGLSQSAALADGADEVRLAARTAFRHGATQIKVCVSGGVVSFTDKMSDAQYSVEELRAAVEEAHNRDTYVTAHAHDVKGIINALDAGLECIEHGTFLDEATAERMASEGCALVPTMSVVVDALEDPVRSGIPESLLHRFDGVLDAMKASTKLAFDKGVQVGSGTDLLGTEQNRRGLELAIKAEVLGPMEAIVSATRTSAQIIRMAEQLGTVEEGKIADLVAVNFDPLDEPRHFEDPDRVVLVVKAGEVVKDLRG